MRTLVCILNHNLPDLTDNCVNQIIQSVNYKNFELMVVDNGSKPMGVSKFTTHKLDENIFFGGALNMVFDYFINSAKGADYLLFLNNDLIFHGYRFLETLLKEATANDIAIFSPSIINASAWQCHWKQMHCWHTNDIRLVQWIDFQAPLIRRDIAEKIGQYPSELFLGWGNDFYTGCIAKKYGFKIAVSDNVTICHLDSQTLKQGKVEGVTLETFNQNADRNMHDYFLKSEFKDLFIEFRHFGSTYSI